MHFMCGRYSITSPLESINNLFQTDSRLNLAPRYNVAPTQDVPVIRAIPTGGTGKAKRDLAMLRWGLIPAWAKEAAIGSRMINARSETVAEKPAFRAAFQQRRCLLAADGFYEWTGGANGPKQPWRITLEGGGLFGFAGLWESWRDPSAGAIESCSIITTEAASGIAHIHHRMPVILMPEAFEAWLMAPANDAASLMAPYAGPLSFHAVSKRLNSVANDDASLIEETEPDIQPKQLALF
ncbi:MAG: SOS response-associated peptidase [Proteobacteria bacterium]|nr:SOS response-associated peptidase [Pseudomonadota bacterium]